MAQQPLPVYLPDNYIHGNDYDDEILLGVQRKFIEELPVASPADTEGENDCGICANELGFRTGPSLRKRGTQPGKLPCGHVLCNGCINNWFGSNNHCPYCRCPFFINPRWPPITRAGIRDYYDRYWEMHRHEVRPILEQEPLSNHTVNFKEMDLHYELVVLAQVFLNELIHAFQNSNMRLTHQANIDYTNQVQDRFEEWMETNNWAVRLRDNGWRPADAFGQAAHDPATADFVRRIGNLTAEFLNRACSVEFMVPVQNAELFRSLVSWLFQMEGLDPNDHNGWKNQVITCMVHCLNHVAQDENLVLAWIKSGNDFLDFENANGGPYPRNLKTAIRREAGLAAIADEDTTFVNENYTPYYRGQ
ncbi:hypothetical protein IWX90DRAFT_292544 [Phyllosticta citrichinensis]|uniref:RING-type domain-containing protein n=1 Tax=Phyllosticta citrichinensis TaxID=1130410 RepID=A0ABR1XK32_9PEZI